MAKSRLLAITFALLVAVATITGGAAAGIDGAAASVNATENGTVENTTVENTTSEETTDTKPTENTTETEPAGPTRAPPDPQPDRQPDNLGPDLHHTLSADSGAGLTQEAASDGEGLFVTVVPAQGAGPAATATGEYGTVEQIVNGEVEATVPKDSVSTLADDSRVERVRFPKFTQQTDLSSSNRTAGSKTIGDEYLRNVSKTGDDVRIAVIDQSFDPTYDPIADNVVETNGYASHGISDGDTAHGDASAQIVTTVAPDVELVLPCFAA
ncbi:hypothetical protein ACFQDD_01920 [Halorubrum pallidum]|uniref:Peptidase S8/S53 domain-containing protein n=1 Tax=Halorubrum pallidum TaxID=1526114 RepID=A0ABD5T337_9EURY